MKLIIFFFGLLIGWPLLIFSLQYWQDPTSILSMKPIELGVTLAQILSPIALLGLISGLWLQQREFRAQGERLESQAERLQRQTEALNKSAIAQEAQNVALIKSADAQSAQAKEIQKQSDRLKAQTDALIASSIAQESQTQALVDTVTEHRLQSRWLQGSNDLQKEQNQKLADAAIAHKQQAEALKASLDQAQLFSEMEDMDRRVKNFARLVVQTSSDTVLQYSASGRDEIKLLGDFQQLSDLLRIGPSIAVKQARHNLREAIARMNMLTNAEWRSEQLIGASEAMEQVRLSTVRLSNYLAEKRDADLGEARVHYNSLNLESLRHLIVDFNATANRLSEALVTAET